MQFCVDVSANCVFCVFVRIIRKINVFVNTIGFEHFVKVMGFAYVFENV